MIGSWWHSLSEREKRLLLIGGMLTCLILLFLLWRPLTAAQDRLQRQVEQKAALLAWMQGAAREIRQLAPSGAESTSGDRSLLPQLEVWIAQRNLDANSAHDNGQIELVLRQSPFDQVLSLIELAGTHGAELGAVEIRALVEPGKVDAELRLIE